MEAGERRLKSENFILCDKPLGHVMWHVGYVSRHVILVSVFDMRPGTHLGVSVVHSNRHPF